MSFDNTSAMVTCDFIARLHEIISSGSTAHNIMNGFENSGNFPVNVSGVIHALKEKKNQSLQGQRPRSSLSSEKTDISKIQLRLLVTSVITVSIASSVARNADDTIK
ncbi:hypothetical protein E4U52_005789 [Claviceps spartinae]|nr:hypothetical protein E4U52_005789 [Claviceps spartinae]